MNIYTVRHRQEWSLKDERLSDLPRLGLWCRRSFGAGRTGLFPKSFGGELPSSYSARNHG